MGPSRSPSQLRGIGLLLSLLGGAAVFAWVVNAHYPIHDWLFFRYVGAWLQVLLLATSCLAAGNALLARFDVAEREFQRLIGQGLPLPAYERVLQASHAFNLLDARGAISVTERQAYILRVRALARACAEAYYNARARIAGFPPLDGKKAA